MKLAKREKYLISLAACCIAIFLVFQFLIFPFFENRTRIQKGLKAKEKGLEEIVRLRAEFQAYQKGSQGIQQTLSRRKKGFTLFSFLEKAAGEAQVKARIKSMKPSVSSGKGPYKESMVEMRLEAITLEELVGYLYRIESPGDLVNIKRISISGNKKEPGYLDAIIQVLTFQ
ncbi:MAG: type II secretion system protein M [Desulfobacterales bacterium]|nr:type II secretion system protein M [Desulfobacterales bacterium]